MNSNRLKWLALITMLIDHIGEFVPETPIVLRWTGRLAAPIFLFCCVWSIEYTSDRKKYLIRLYIASLIMSIIQCKYNISSNFFRTIFSLCLILYLYEAYKTKEDWKKYMFLYIFWQFLTILITIVLINVGSHNNLEIHSYVIPALFGNIFNLEGGIIFVLLGVIFYLYKDNRRKLTVSFILFDIIYFLLSTTSVIGIALGKIRHVGFVRIYEVIDYILLTIVGLGQMDVGGSPIFENFQWMMIFSLFFILTYNGEEGKKHKWFFYIFYPLHILLLCIFFHNF